MAEECVNMASGRFCFDRFTLDFRERTLSRDNQRLELNSRYFDALALLVSEDGRLVSKERFLSEVWRGVPVTDEALTQCIKTLRRQLGDNAANPQFIETIPKHGYRFVAPVKRIETGPRLIKPPTSWRRLFLLGTAGTVGGGFAGLVGGLIYGFAAALSPNAPAMGAVSVLVVVVFATTLVALLGAAGVAFGVAASSFSPNRLLAIPGGAIGGMAIGAVVKLLGLDALTLLVGHSPSGITGPFEGAVVGAAVGFAVWLTKVFGSANEVRRSICVAAFAGAAGGALIVALGGHLMGGSLELLQTGFPGSRIRLDRVAQLFGEPTFGRLSETVTAALEIALFGAFLVGAMAIVGRRLEYRFGPR